jgi:hypothetical protein
MGGPRGAIDPLSYVAPGVLGAPPYKSACFGDGERRGLCGDLKAKRTL